MDKYVTTAGHCTTWLNYTFRNGTGGAYGTVKARIFHNGADVDAEILLHEQNPWTSPAEFIGDDLSDIRDVTAVTCWSCYATGQWAGASTRSGTKKGPITSTNTSLTVENPWQPGTFITTSELVRVSTDQGGYPHVIKGDSGGAVFRSNSAIGIVHASDFDDLF